MGSMSSSSFQSPYITDNDPVADDENSVALPLSRADHNYPICVSSIKSPVKSHSRTISSPNSARDITLAPRIHRRNEKLEEVSLGEGEVRTQSQESQEETIEEIDVNIPDESKVIARCTSPNNRDGNVVLPKYEYMVILKDNVHPIFGAKDFDEHKEMIILYSMKVTRVHNPFPCDITVNIDIGFMSGKMNPVKDSFVVKAGHNEPYNKTVYTFPVDLDLYLLQKSAGRDKILDQICSVPSSGRGGLSSTKRYEDLSSVKEKRYFSHHSGMSFRKNSFVHQAFCNSAVKLMEKDENLDFNVYKVQSHDGLVCFAPESLGALKDGMTDSIFSKFSYLNTEYTQVSISVRDTDGVTIHNMLEKENIQNQDVTVTIVSEFIKVPKDSEWLSYHNPVRISAGKSYV